jgi:hypothetical protein
MKPLERVRFWIIIVWFAAIIVFVGVATRLGTGLLILSQPSFWLAVVIISILCVGAYFLAKWNLGRK